MLTIGALTSHNVADDNDEMFTVYVICQLLRPEGLWHKRTPFYISLSKPKTKSNIKELSNIFHIKILKYCTCT